MPEDRIELDRVNHFVLRKQHLVRSPDSASVEQIVRDIGGLHATSPTTPYLSLFARMDSFTRDQLDEALYVRKTLGKIRCVRKTVYVLPRDMIPVAFAAVKPMVELASDKYCRYLGVSQEEYEALSALVLKAVDNNALSIDEIKRALKTGSNLSPVLNLMCDQGRLIRGAPKNGWRSNKHTYQAFGAYFPGMDLSGPPEKEAISRLVRHYLRAFGPATETDIIWWTGLNRKKVRDGLEALKALTSRLAVTGVEGRHVVLRSDGPGLASTGTALPVTINLLPSLDPYIMGYRERDRYLSRQHYDMVFDRSGNATSMILLNGRVAGVWDFMAGEPPIVKLYLFEGTADQVTREIRREAERTGQFIAGKKVRIKECESMTPLTQRTAGSVMTPLKDS